MLAAMRVVTPLCAARLTIAATSTTALYATRIATGFSTSTSVRSVGAPPLQRLSSARLSSAAPHWPLTWSGERFLASTDP